MSDFFPSATPLCLCIKVSLYHIYTNAYNGKCKQNILSSWAPPLRCYVESYYLVSPYRQVLRLCRWHDYACKEHSMVARVITTTMSVGLCLCLWKEVSFPGPFNWTVWSWPSGGEELIWSSGEGQGRISFESSEKTSLKRERKFVAHTFTSSFLLILFLASMSQSIFFSSNFMDLI